jgi:hypothetical protein
MTEGAGTVILTLALGGALCACAPLQADMTMPNPSRTRDKIEARQTYEVGPLKENHRYEAAITGWRPDALQFAIRLVNSSDECSNPASFTFTLVDEAGQGHPFKPTGAPVRKSANGRKGAALKEVTLTGEFAVAVGPATRAVVLRVRQHPGGFCRDLDFRWEFAP